MKILAIMIDDEQIFAIIIIDVDIFLTISNIIIDWLDLIILVMRLLLLLTNFSDKIWFQSQKAFFDDFQVTKILQMTDLKSSFRIFQWKQCEKTNKQTNGIDSVWDKEDSRLFQQ